MNLRERLFLISGNDSVKRRQAETGIKQKILEGKDCRINTITLYVDELGKETIPEDIANNYFGANNLIILKNFLTISSLFKSFILSNLKKIIKDSFIIFETDDSLYHIQREKKIASDELFKLVLNSAVRFSADSFNRVVSINLFLNSLNKNNIRTSMDVLERLFKDNPNTRIGPQVLGMLVKKISYISKDSHYSWINEGLTKYDCLQYLYQADRQIKEKGLNDRLVIETLLGKIFKLQR